MIHATRYAPVSVLLLGSCSLIAQTRPTNDQLKQYLEAHPPQELAQAFAESRRHMRGGPASIEVQSFVTVDLDGSGEYNYVVVLYEAGADSEMALFKWQGETLSVLAQEPVASLPGLQLRDVNGDGIPEIVVTGTDQSGREEFISIYSWTGSSLHDMTPDVEHGTIEDIDGDGIMEIVYDESKDERPAGEEDTSPAPQKPGFDIYKLQGDTYRFYKTVATDPTGSIGPDGTFHYVRAFCKQISPARFSTSELAGRGPKDGGVVRLRFGGLDDVHGGPVPVDRLDPASIVIGPRLALPASACCRAAMETPAETSAPKAMAATGAGPSSRCHARRS